MTFSAGDLTQITQSITNIDTKNKKVPFPRDLETHPVYGSFFSNMSPEQVAQIDELLHDHIQEKITWLSTKWGEFFKRFYALNKDDFWAFRALNADEAHVDSPEFQRIWKHLEQELFKFENMLTQNMGKRSYGLDKVVSAFYDIAYSFFPLMSLVK